MRCAPIGHDITLEAELVLENAIEGLAVLAAIRSVNSTIYFHIVNKRVMSMLCGTCLLIRTHNGRDASLNRVLERPEVDFVHGAVIDVGGDCFDRFAVF